jgi:hypothetical protein
MIFWNPGLLSLQAAHYPVILTFDIRVVRSDHHRKFLFLPNSDLQCR